MGSPNGNWKPWLMAELEKKQILAASVYMPEFDNPTPEGWSAELTHQINLNPEDEIYLVGHSLGGTTILHYLQSQNAKPVSGAIFVGSPCGVVKNNRIDNFFTKSFDFQKIRSNCHQFSVIHSDNDPYVPEEHAHILAKELSADLTIVPRAGHFNTASGSFTLPKCLDSLMKMTTRLTE